MWGESCRSGTSRPRHPGRCGALCGRATPTLSGKVKVAAERVERSPRAAATCQQRPAL